MRDFADSKEINITKTERKKYIKTFYYKNKLRFVIAIVALMLFCAMQIFVANIMRLLTDAAANGDRTKLVSFILLSCTYLIALTIIQSVSMKTKYPFIKKAMNQYKDMTFSDIINKNIVSFDVENTGSYISILTNDANSIETNYLMGSFEIVKNILLIIGALAMMLYFHGLLTLVAIMSSFLPLIIATLLGQRVVAKEKKVSEENETYVSLVKDLLTGFSVIKSFKAEKEVLRLFSSKNYRLEDAKCNRRMASGTVGIVAIILSFFSEISVFVYGAWLAINGKITVGVVIAFVQLMNYIIEPISKLPTLIADKNSAISLIDKFIVVSKKNSKKDGVVEIKNISTGISFDKVYFGYSDEKVLKNVNLYLEKGKSYAIVGASGSGKSTLLNMILGKHDLYNGSIKIDEIEITDIKRSSLYDVASIIQQNVFIFNSTIQENISMFKEFDVSKINCAIEKAGLNTVVCEKGLDYICSENGTNLSGGERQRISIARSLLKNTSILLMDEISSSLDSETAKNVESAILDIEGLTRIVVTHRLDEELLKKYDSIILMQNGRIEEIGKYEDLIEQKGYFYDLLNLSNRSA